MIHRRSFFPTRSAASFPTRLAALAAVAVLAVSLPAASLPAAAQVVTGNTTTPTDQNGQKTTSVTATATFPDKKKKQKVAKDERVQQTKDTRAELKREKKLNPLVGKDADLPDKQLYDKAISQANKGHFEVARLDLQTLLNTYPDSQYQMRAKLAIADSWYKEGGTAALAQAEQEYKDFITFFPNAPEAAEAQMRVGDIYLKQMDVPDRDYTKAIHAEEEYRNMLRQYPDAPKPLLEEARQKLRDVQEVLATREAALGAFYATHENWPATLARYQTVVDTYPQYSHMDDVLIGIGDVYAVEARNVRAQPTCAAGQTQGCIPEAAKARLEQQYDGLAGAAYRKVVLEHAAAPHVEDAKERLAAMDLPIPTPTPEQVAASDALEGSRAQYTMRKRLELFFIHHPDTVTAARLGEPPLEDPPAVVAPSVVRTLEADYRNAIVPGSAVAPSGPVNPAAGANAATSDAAGTPAPAGPAAPPTLQDVGNTSTGNGDVTTMMPTERTTGSAPGASVGVEVLTPGVNASPNGVPAANPTTPPVDTPAAHGAPDPNYGLNAAGPKNNTPLPPVEKAAEAPDQVNDASGKPQPPAEVKDPNAKKNPKPAFDKEDESSSKHKKKKGLDKVNPF